MNIPFPAYQGDEPFIFVCYAHEDADLVYAELVWLRDHGYNIWYDEGIRPGEEWLETLGHAILKATHFLFFVTPNSVDSRYCRDEVQFALTQEKNIVAAHLQPSQLTVGLQLSLGSSQAIFKYELTTEEFREKLQSTFSSSGHFEPERPIDRNTWKNRGLLAVVAAIVVLIALLSPLKPDQSTDSSTIRRATSPMIGVLPFVNMSSDPENAYFSDGISEEILNTLVRTNTIPVIARTSSFQFRGQNLDVTEIGERLKVTHILEGSVRKNGEQLRINAQLIDAISGLQIWSESYSRMMPDIFSIQNDIASAIVMETQIHLAANDPTPQQSRVINTQDMVAYDLFLRAEHLLRQLHPGDLRKAISLYREATVLDSDFVDAWVGLCEAYRWQTNAVIAGEIPANVYPLIRQAAEKALSLDPDNAKALASLATVSAYYEFEWSDAIRLLERAVIISPLDADVLATYGGLLSVTGMQTATEVLERAYQLDPVSPNTVLNLADHFNSVGSQDEAMRLIEPLRFSEQDNYSVNMALMHFYVNADRLQLSETLLNRAKAMVPGNHLPIRAAELTIARMKGDDQTADIIKSEITRRITSEYRGGPEKSDTWISG